MEVRLLCAPAACLHVDGERVALPPGRPTRLLTALALVPGEVVDRDTLVRSVWDDAPPASLRNALHVYVSRLRTLLGASAIITSGSGYCLALPPETIDAVRFERLIEQAQSAVAAGQDKQAVDLLEQAIDLHRAPLLGRDALSQPLEDARARLYGLFDLARDTVLTLRLPTATPAEAGALAGRAKELVAEAPLREDRQVLLIEALHASGRSAEALIAYDTAVAALKEQLGASPTGRLQELRRRIISERLSGGTVADSGFDPLIGRDEQVDTVVALVRERRLVTITGPGGIGKSRVAARAIERLRPLFGDRILHLDLADVEPGEDLCGLVAAAAQTTLGADWESAGGPDDQPSLLVLDTCDRHDVTVLTDLVNEERPQLHVLTTGRKVVGAAGEAVLRVGPLDGGDGESSEAELRESSAVQLYLHRARDAGHAVEDSLIHDVARLVRAIDRCPLAIGLAAAHPDGGRPDLLLTRPLTEIVGLVNHHSAVRRHRSEISSLQWTLDLLSEDARAVLRTACELPSDTPDALVIAGSDATDPVSGFDELMRWSVLLRPSSPVRLASIPHTVRSTVTAQTSDDERRAIHARLRLALAQRADRLLLRPLSVPRTVEDSEQVFRLGEAALLAHSWPEAWPTPEARALALLLLVDTPLSRSQQTEYAQWISTTLEQPLTADLRFDLQRVRVGVALTCSDPEQVAEATADMARLLPDVDQRRQACWAVDSVFLALEEGRFTDAVELGEAAALTVAEAGETESPLGVRAGRALMHARHLNSGLEAGMVEALQTAALADLVDCTESISAFGESAEILVNAGELDLGTRFTKRAARLALRWNSPHSLVHVLSLADIAFEEGRIDESRAIVHALLDRVWRRGNDRYMKWCLIRLAQIAEMQEDHKKAATLLGASSSISMTAGWDADPDVCELLETLPAALGGESFRYSFERGAAAPRGWVTATLDEMIPLPDTLHPDVLALLRQSSPLG